MATLIQDLMNKEEEKMEHSLDATIREFAEVRTGRASPGLVEGIRVEYYGVMTPLKQLATITTPDPKTIVIQPWDISVVNEVEKAILASSLGLTPNNDGKLIRINIPNLTDERREDLLKLVKKMAEDGRVSIRTIRRDANENVKKLEKEDKITEDERFKTQDRVQKLTDKYIEKVDGLLKSKEGEIRE